MNGNRVFKKWVYTAGFVLFVLLSNNPAALWAKKDQELSFIAQCNERLLLPADNPQTKERGSTFSNFLFSRNPVNFLLFNFNYYIRQYNFQIKSQFRFYEFSYLSIIKPLRLTSIIQPGVFLRIIEKGTTFYSI